jgi:hypothetical protein
LDGRQGQAAKSRLEGWGKSVSRRAQVSGPSLRLVGSLRQRALRRGKRYSVSGGVLFWFSFWWFGDWKECLWRIKTGPARSRSDQGKEMSVVPSFTSFLPSYLSNNSPGRPHLPRSRCCDSRLGPRSSPCRLDAIVLQVLATLPLSGPCIQVSRRPQEHCLPSPHR